MMKDTSLVWHRVDAQDLDLKGRRVAIVGGTGGIGRAFSRSMASRGASVVVVGQTFRDAGESGIEFVKADLTLMRDAQRVAALLPAEALDLVIFTTGIFAGPKREETADGIERDLAVSYLNRLVMVREIAPRLGKDRPAARTKPRLFIVAYPGLGHTGNPDDLNSEKSYAPRATHLNTVAGNEMLVLDSAKRYPDLDVFGLNPGVIKTNIRSNILGPNTFTHRLVEGLIGLFTPTPKRFAEQLTPLLVSPDLEGRSGALFDSKGFAILPSPGLTDSHMKRFIAASEALASRAGVPVAA
jgi:NAD(P)-dependent dehydrogenase (short-subunit alcohol dehydrogenase family)